MKKQAMNDKDKTKKEKEEMKEAVKDEAEEQKKNVSMQRKRFLVICSVFVKNVAIYL